MEIDPHGAFAQTYQGYLEKIRAADLSRVAAAAGVALKDGALCLPFLDRAYRVGPEGVTGPEGETPRLPVCVALFNWVLRFPASPPPPGGWASYRDFADAAPFARAYAANVEHALARAFSGKPEELAGAVQKRGGAPPEQDYPYDVAAAFAVLPNLPALVLFNDGDEDFPATAKVLWDKTAPLYLDPESLAICGWILADLLITAAGGKPGLGL
ncbi:MAG: DUF3786 domain-containing protein [Deltaproteobacteria bacterium]|nr:DUF3786 domain-containing protein [Deltaproteobacteria bacterium]